jgi:hypothetical protein
MEDDELARLVARDLGFGLGTWASELGGEGVFAAALWIGDVYGDFFALVGTERWYARVRQAPAFAALPDDLMSGPSFRWHCGSWDAGGPFLSAETEEALGPLARMANGDKYDLQAQCEASRRWREIGFTAVALTEVPSTLHTTPMFLLFGESVDCDRVEAAEGMLRTVPPRRLHAAIPAWRRLAAKVRSALADEDEMARLRLLVADGAGKFRFPFDSAAPAADELTALLKVCGLWWHDVTSYSERLQRALAIADRE